MEWRNILVFAAVFLTAYGLFYLTSSYTTPSCTESDYLSLKHQGQEQSKQTDKRCDNAPNKTLCWKGTIIPDNFPLPQIIYPDWYENDFASANHPITHTNLNYGQPIADNITLGSRPSFSSASYAAEYVYFNYFYNVTYGTYVELGAHDGRYNSNSLWFSEKLGWRGVLIEATNNFDNLARVRPNDIRIKSVVCNNFSTYHFTTDNHATSGIVEFMDDEFLSKWHPAVKAVLHDLDNSPLVAPISCVPLDYLLEPIMTHINFFTLDVEGGEYQILQSIDWDRIKIDVFCIEPHHTELIIPFLASKGYIYMGTWPHGWDLFFMHHTFKQKICMNPNNAQPCPYSLKIEHIQDVK